MKRRTFLKQGAATAAMPFVLGGLPMQALAQEGLLGGILNNCDDRVLVLVQLNGGNDGLNTILPLNQYTNLAVARPDLLIPANQALLLNSHTDLGLHPVMGGFRDLYQDNKMGIVHSVGYPDPNFSHFRSTDIWTSGSPSDVNWTTGWLGRYLDTIFPNYPTNYPNPTHPDPLAITIGSVVSQTCQGPVTNMSMAIPNLNSFLDLSSGAGSPVPNNRYGFELNYLRELMNQTNQYFNVVENAANLGSNLANYPNTRLAAQLKIVANLISGGLRTSVYVVNIGGFDTHARQVETGAPTTGEHAVLLQTVSDAVAAFQDDLRQLGLEKRVVGMTFSEFGRRIRSNASEGTDHGAAAPLFVFGTEVNPIIHGTIPTIGTNLGVKDNIPMQFDFRSIYGSILEDWFCVPEATIKNLLFPDYQHIPVIKQAITSIDEPQLAPSFSHYPNPFSDQVTLTFELQSATNVRVSLFNSEGKEIEHLLEGTYPAGSHEFRYNSYHLASGMYYARIQAGPSRVMRPLIKR